MKQAEKVREVLTKSKNQVMEMMNKEFSVEDILVDPDAAYMMGNVLKIYDEYADLAFDMANQIDEMEEMLRNSYRVIKDISEQMNELRKEVAKAQ